MDDFRFRDILCEHFVPTIVMQLEEIVRTTRISQNDLARLSTVQCNVESCEGESCNA